MATVVSACVLHNPHGYGTAVRKLRRDSIQLPHSAPCCCKATHLQGPSPSSSSSSSSSSSAKFGTVNRSANNPLLPETIQGEISLLTRIPGHFNNVELAAGATIALAVAVALFRALIKLAAKKPVRALKLATAEPVQIHGGESLRSIGEDANAALSDKSIMAYRMVSFSEEERNFPNLQELQNPGCPKQARGGLWAGDSGKSSRFNGVNFGEVTAADNSVALAVLAEPREWEEGIIRRALAVGLSSRDRPPIEVAVDGALCPAENPLSDSVSEDDEVDLAVDRSGFVYLSEAVADEALIVPSSLTDADSLPQPSYLGSDVDSQPLPIMNVNVSAKQEEQSSLSRNRTIQAAVPIIAIGAGALGAVMGVEGAMELVGVVATASFVTYELLWAQTRKRLWEDLESVTDHKKLMSFLKSRDIIKHF